MANDNAEAKEVTFVKGAIRRAGLPARLADDLKEAVKALAYLVRDHATLQMMLTKMDPGFRRKFYECLSADLPFRPHPLDWYLAQAAMQAEREKLPTIDEAGKLIPFRAAQDVSSIKIAQETVDAVMARRNLTLTCDKCTRKHTFVAFGEESPSAVVNKARRAGWVYDYKSDPRRELCPECSSL